MRRSVKVIRKLVVSLIGFPVLILGLILIPLPGPGILVCAVGLFILSMEFDWAERHLRRARTELNKLMRKARDKQKES